MRYVFYGIILLSIRFSFSETKALLETNGLLPVKQDCDNGYIFIATADGVLSAYSYSSGIQCWSVKLDPMAFISSSMSELEIWNRDSRVFIIPSLDGRIYEYDKWKLLPLPFTAESLLTEYPDLHHFIAISGGKVKIIYGVDRHTGTISYKCSPDDCQYFNEVLEKDLIIVEEVIHSVRAVDSRNTEQRWHFRVAELDLKNAYPVMAEKFSEAQQDKLRKHDFLLLENEILKDSKQIVISLINGYVARINSTTLMPKWISKSSSPIVEAWFVNDKSSHILDPFGKASDFSMSSTHSEDQNNLGLLFLGSYKNQLFVKQSRLLKKKFTNVKNSPILMKHMFTNSVPEGSHGSFSNSLSYRYKFEVKDMHSNANMECKKEEKTGDSENATTTIIVPDEMLDFGYLFYVNLSNSGNDTHCVDDKVLNTYNERTYRSWDQLPVFTTWCSITLLVFLITVFLHFEVMETMNKNKDENSQELSYKLAFQSKTESQGISNKEITKPCFDSRFFNEYKFISQLGKGGYGIVMEAVNKIDNRVYAVKRIPIKDFCYDLQHEQVLKEVRMLAQLDHPGIVRYFNSWIEHPPTDWQSEKDAEYEINEGSNCYFLQSGISLDQSTESSSNIMDINKKLKQNPLFDFSEIFVDDFNKGVELGTSNEGTSCSEQSLESWGITFREGKAMDSIEPNDKNQISICEKCSDKESMRNSYNENTHFKEFSKEDFQNILIVDKVQERLIKNMKCNCNKISKTSSDHQSILHGFSTAFKIGSCHNKESIYSENVVSKSEENSRQSDSNKSSLISVRALKKGKLCHPESNDNGKPGFLYIQMEICRKESLENWLRQNWQVHDYAVVMLMFFQITEAVHYVHAQGLMHRDLKPSNIFFSLEGDIKIGDFGLATYFCDEPDEGTCASDFSDFHTKNLGTKIYMSPEQESGNYYTSKTDIFSLGLIFLELLVPFHTLAEKFKALKAARKMEFQVHIMQAYPKEMELLKSMLSKRPKERPAASEILNGPILKNFKLR